jgi:hypothetical protein
MKNEILVKMKIFWKNHPSYHRYYYTSSEADGLILLRMNNFPDEPLYTLINGLSILDLEDLPSGWNLEYPDDADNW